MTQMWWFANFAKSIEKVVRTLKESNPRTGIVMLHPASRKWDEGVNSVKFSHALGIHHAVAKRYGVLEVIDESESSVLLVSAKSSHHWGSMEAAFVSVFQGAHLKCSKLLGKSIFVEANSRKGVVIEKQVKLRKGENLFIRFASSSIDLQGGAVLNGFDVRLAYLGA